MITEALLEAVGLIIESLAALLPSVDVPMWDEVMGLADDLNGWLFVFDGLLPLRDLAEFIRWVGAVWIPGYLAFHLVRWIWGHVPVLGSGT